MTWYLMTLIIIDFILAVLLACIILMQSSKGGGLAGLVGGGESVFGPGHRNPLRKVTVTLSILFAVLTLMITFLQPKGAGSSPRVPIPQPAPVEDAGY